MKRKTLPKSIIVVSLVAVLAIVVPVMSGCLPGKPAAAPPAAPPEGVAEVPTYKWKVQCVWGSYWNEQNTAPMLKRLEEATGGRMEFDLFMIDELVPTDQHVRAVQTGTLDLSLAAGPITAAPLDIAELDGITAFGWLSVMEGQALWFHTRWGELVTQAYEELGDLKVIGLYAGDPTHLMTSKPVRTYEDLNGLKIMGWDMFSPFFEPAGIVSHVVPFEEMYLAGQTGILDGECYGGTTEGVGMGIHEVFPYLLTPPINGTWLCVWIVNEESWNALPKDLQETVKLALAWHDRKCTYFEYWYENENTKYFTVTSLPPEDWDKLRQPAIDHWDEIAQISPRTAEMIQILKDYNESVDANAYFRCR